MLLLWKCLKEGSNERYEMSGQLGGHESTVVCLQFSFDSKLLASAGKDRRLCLFAFQEAQDSFQNVLTVANAHKRIIWDLCWNQSNDHLVTASRDGSCKIWHYTRLINENNECYHHHLSCSHSFAPFDGLSVTAITYLSHATHQVMVVGAESGLLQLWTCQGKKCCMIGEVPEESCHSQAVKRICPRPQAANRTDQHEAAVMEWDWASCGEDRTVRIHHSRIAMLD